MLNYNKRSHWPIFSFPLFLTFYFTILFCSIVFELWKAGPLDSHELHLFISFSLSLLILYLSVFLVSYQQYIFLNLSYSSFSLTSSFDLFSSLIFLLCLLFSCFSLLSLYFYHKSLFLNFHILYLYLFLLCLYYIFLIFIILFLSFPPYTLFCSFFI